MGSRPSDVPPIDTGGGEDDDADPQDTFEAEGTVHSFLLLTLYFILLYPIVITDNQNFKVVVLLCFI